MSDSTANAREPSMEDILASIRRIIDEEDTRDARPASDLAVDSMDEDDAGSLPVMAAAPVNRDGEGRAGDEGGFFGSDDDVQADDVHSGDVRGGDSVFPERESSFWSRATGRGEAPGGADDPDALADMSDTQADLPGSTRTDIFRRAQSKLGSTPRMGTRERIQSLAARAEERAENPVRDPEAAVGAVVPDMHASDVVDASDREDDGILSLPDDLGDRDAPAFDAIDTGDVLDLTEPLDHPAPADEQDEETAPRFDSLPDAGETDARDDGFGAMDVSNDYASESLRGFTEDDGPVADDSADDARDEIPRQEDVLDLTVPVVEEAATVDAGSVESGDDFHVSEVDTDFEPETDEQNIEDAISHRLGTDEGNFSPDDSDEADDEAQAATGTTAAVVLAGAGALAGVQANTYSRFDREADRDEGESAASESAPERDDPEPEDFAPDDAVTEDAVADDPESAASMWQPPAQDTPDPVEPAAGAPEPDPVDAERVDSDEGTMDRPAADAPEASERETSEQEAETTGTSDAYAAAFTMLDDEPAMDAPDYTAADAIEPDDLDGGDLDLDDLDIGDELGFSDTFGASDVYHDDPPALDDDYSRSLEVEDEPVAAQASRSADGSSDGPRDDEMEKVGGLVRDAMERDPVDYADPSALVSMTSEEISARALASLADVEGEASRRMFGSLRISDDGGSESLEGMVRGMLRPLLREWLDDNLPNMVETAVRGEVERISAKSRKYSRSADKD